MVSNIVRGAQYEYIMFLILIGTDADIENPATYYVEGITLEADAQDPSGAMTEMGSLGWDIHTTTSLRMNATTVMVLNMMSKIAS